MSVIHLGARHPGAVHAGSDLLFHGAANCNGTRHLLCAEHEKQVTCKRCLGTVRKPRTTIEERIEQIVSTLVEAMVHDDKDVLSVREIAERIDASPPQVNSAIGSMVTTERGWRRIEMMDTYVDVRERNFNSVTHQRRCQGYIVTREHLASIIRSLKEQEA